VVPISAVPVEGGAYIGVSGDCVEDRANADRGSAFVQMDGDRSCFVYFYDEAQVEYPVRVQVEGAGRVVSQPAGISCDASGDGCSARYRSGSSLQLTAEEETGWLFAGWGRDCADEFSMTAQLDVTQGIACAVYFVRTIEVAVTGPGSVTVSGSEDLPCDSVCTVATTDAQPVLSATALLGARLLGFTGDCDADDDTAVMHADGVRCEAHFEWSPPALTVAISGGGRVSGGAIDCPGVCTVEVPLVPPVDLPWSCPIGYRGTGDGCDCACGEVDPDCPSTLSSACEYVAQDCVVVSEHNNLCTSDLVAGTVELQAIANEGSVFAGYGGDCAGTEPLTSVAVSSSMTCTATFQP
jgi:hypothetical protein